MCLKLTPAIFDYFACKNLGLSSLKCFYFINSFCLFLVSSTNHEHFEKKFQGYFIFTEAFHKKIARTALKKSEIRIFSYVYILRTRQVMFASYFNYFFHTLHP